MIARTMKGTGWIASAIFRSAVYKYAKDRGVWYYRILLSQQLERKLNPDPFSSVQKKVFSVDDRGNIYDDRTGEVFGNTNDKINNKFDMDNEEDAQMEEEVKPKRGRPKKT
jgi:hypothetical protein